MLKPSKLLFASVVVFCYLLFPTEVQLFSFSQSSIIVVYFVFLYLCYPAYTNLNTMTIARYETKGDLCFDFIIKQGLFCLVYLIVLTAAGFFFLFLKPVANTTVPDVILFFLIHLINLILLGLVLLLLRILYGTVVAFVSVGFYIGLSAFLSVFLGKLGIGQMINPFITVYAYGEPFGSGTVVAYVIVLFTISILAVLFKKKDMKV